MWIFEATYENMDLESSIKSVKQKLREKTLMKKNKLRWKNLDMWERLARRRKQNGASEDTVEHIREHGRKRKEENQQMKHQFHKEKREVKTLELTK